STRCGSKVVSEPFQITDSNIIIVLAGIDDMCIRRFDVCICKGSVKTRFHCGDISFARLSCVTFSTCIGRNSIKIFLTASPESRAKRRYDELQAKGDPATYEEVLADMIKRDYDDSHRAAAPLKQAQDAVLVDTSGDTLEQSVARIKAVVLEKLAQ
ncbi:MAG: (d)CMP kinase, partial [Clostridia bacterium]|nr:(d)CMP kinase [Clostridia bacterium]